MNFPAGGAPVLAYWAWGDPAVRPILSFRLFRIPVDVQPHYLLIVLGALSLRDAKLGVLWVAIVTAGILWHELGHALTMRAFGYAPSISLVATGGLAHFPPGADPSARQDLLISAAGPGANLLLGGAVWALARFGPPLPWLAQVALDMALTVNLGWSLLNLLPLLPLDGSHIFDSITRMVNGRREPSWVGWASAVCGVGVVLYAITRQDMWLGVIGGFGAMLGWRRAQGGGGVRAGGDARQQARRARSRGDLRGIVAALLPMAEAGRLLEADLAQLVSALVRTGGEADLVELVRSRLQGFGRRADARPLAQLALDGLSMAGAHEEAATVAQLAFRQLRLSQHAYEAAIHLVALDRLEEAMEWLRRASEAGLDCGAMMLSDPALEPLRARPDFLELATRAGAEPGAA